MTFSFLCSLPFFVAFFALGGISSVFFKRRLQLNVEWENQIVVLSSVIPSLIPPPISLACEQRISFSDHACTTTDLFRDIDMESESGTCSSVDITKPLRSSKCLLQPKCLAFSVPCLASVVAIFMGHDNGDNKDPTRDGTWKASRKKILKHFRFTTWSISI